MSASTIDPGSAGPQLGGSTAGAVLAPTPDEKADCTVVVVTYNSAAHISALLDSLPAAAGHLQIRCVVVDNGSRDGTIDMLRTRRDVTLIETGRNLGYAGAINVARARLDLHSSVLILNPDVELGPGAIVRLNDTLEEPGVGVAVPMLLNEDGSRFFTLRREPSLTRALGDALFGAHFPSRPGWLSETIYADRAYDRPTDVAWSTGAALLISSDCNATVGVWDSDRFFLYSEETDFFARAWRCGYRVRYVPSAIARHEGGASGRSASLAALLAVNRIRYYEKYHGRGASFVFRCAVALACLLRSYTPEGRAALCRVSRRSRWARLPAGSED